MSHGMTGLLSLAKKVNSKRNQNKFIKGIEGLRVETQKEVKVIQNRIDSELSGIAKLERQRNQLLSAKQHRESRQKLENEVESLRRQESKAVFKELGIRQPRRRK